MISIRIASEERKLAEADPRWINEQINRRQAEREAVCVRVTIHEDDVNMVLSTPTCPSTPGGGRAPNRVESEIFALWEKLHLNTMKFTGGNLNAFLNQLASLLGLRRAA